MSRENTSPLPHGDGEGRCLTSSPCAALLWSVALRGIPVHQLLRSSCRAGAPASSVAAMCQPWFYRRLEAYGFVGLSEGAYGGPRDSLPNPPRDTHPRTRALRRRKKLRQRETGPVLCRAERLGCLWLQLLGVEAFSFLPNAQGNGGDLARQRQARHGGLQAFGQQAFIELTERAVDNAGRRRRTLKQVFQIVIVVAVESADEHRFLGAHQLSVLEAVIGAAARLQGQPAVGPELTFAAEAVRRLYPPDQLRRANRTQQG